MRSFDKFWINQCYSYLKTHELGLECLNIILFARAGLAASLERAARVNSGLFGADGG